VAEAIARILDDPATRGNVYELGGPRFYSFKEIMELVLAETGRRRWLVPVPLRLAEFEATLLELLPTRTPLLTRDQVLLMRRDNLVSPDALTFADLGIAPTPVEAILPSYMDIYRRGGRNRNPRLAQGNDGPAP
jgi:NADH dehydrogenase